MTGNAVVDEDARKAAIQAFHAEALRLLEIEGDNDSTRQQIALLLQDLARTPNILPTVALARLHDSGSTATILHQGADGRGALMLLCLPADVPTPVHNHNSWGIACVVQGINRYWRWERLDDLADPNRADIRLVEVFDHGAGEFAIWGDPPQDLHAQQGVGGDAYEFVFFGRNPNLQPRSYFDPETGEVTHALATDSSSLNADMREA